MAGSFNPDDIYPTYSRPDDTWWVFRTIIKNTIGDKEVTVVAYTPLSVKIHPYKDQAIQYMQDKLSSLKPTSVTVITGPASKEEAFAWTTLNPYVHTEDAPQVSA